MTLVDQFGPMNAKVGYPWVICNPANKNNEDPSAPQDAEHLEGYQITPPGRVPYFQPVRNQKIVDEFGTIYVDVLRPVHLLVPTAENWASPPPPLAAPRTDHFTCYRVRRTPGTTAFTSRAVTLGDEFGSAVVRAWQPTQLCAPTDKNGEAPGTEKHVSHLMCYRIVAPFRSIGRVFVDNQFGPGQLYPVQRYELCVPALKYP